MDITKLNQYLENRVRTVAPIQVSHDLGNYLSIEDGQIILNSNKYPLLPLRFDNEQVMRTLVVEINRLYGEHLEWLGWSGWLSDIRQIHMDQQDRYRFGDFINCLIKLNKTITQEDCVKCWTKSKSD